MISKTILHFIVTVKNDIHGASAMVRMTRITISPEDTTPEEKEKALALELYNKTCTAKFPIGDDDYIDDIKDHLLKVSTVSVFLNVDLQFRQDNSIMNLKISKTDPASLIVCASRSYNI